MQDMEFTIERGKLFMLQTRNGKRTAAAALQIAVDLVNEGMLHPTKKRSAMIDPKSLDAAASSAPLTPPHLRQQRQWQPVLPHPPVRHAAWSTSRQTMQSAQAKRATRLSLRRKETTPRGHRGHDRFRGHPHRLRRHDQPRCGCCKTASAPAASPAAGKSLSTNPQRRSPSPTAPFFTKATG